MRGGALLRGLSILALLASLVLMLAACGGAGKTTTVTVTTATAPSVDEEADAAILDEVLARQTGAIAAYERTLPKLQGERRSAALHFLAQEQEHVDGLLKAFRALREPARGKPEAIVAKGLKTEADQVRFLYELENATIEQEQAAIDSLTSPTARTTLLATMANQAEHLVVLRRFLGANLAESVPSAFETGTTPAPSGMIAE